MAQPNVLAMPRHPNHSSPARSESQILAIGIAFTLLVVGVQTVAALVNGLALDDRHAELNPDVEGNTFTWLAASLAAVAAWIAFTLGLLDRARIWSYWAIGVLTAYLSLDDATILHERIGSRIARELGLETYVDRIVQPLLVIPAAGVLVLLLLRSRDAPRGPGRLIRIGLACLVLAVVAEIVARVAEIDPPATADYIEVAIEEGLELGGWALVATALTALLVDRIRHSPAGPAAEGPSGSSPAAP